MTNAGLAPKSTLRKGELLLYCKKADTVEDFLSFIGAQSASFEIMNDAILRGIRASINRQNNCDTTNLKRAVEAASLQLAAINAIIENEGSLDGLPITLRETAKIRLENPIDTLDEIIDVHLDKITKSGVNHRFAKIIAYAKNKGYINNLKK
jgi:DNA-binding protein WhiA